MNQCTKRNKSIELIGILYILVSITPTFSYLFRDFYGSTVLFFIFLLIVLNRRSVNIKYIFTNNFCVIICILLITIVLLLELFFNRGTGQLNIFFLISRILMICIFNNIMSKYFYLEYKFIKKKVFIILSILILISIFYILKNFNIVKLVTGQIADVSNQLYIEATINGVGGSLYYLAFACMIPIFIGNLINKKYIVNIFIDYIFCILICIVTLLSTGLSAIAIMIIGICIIIVININIFNITSIVKLICIVTLISGIGITSFQILSKNENFDIMFLRVEEIFNSFENKNISDESYNLRKELNNISIQTFKQNPIFGVGTNIGSIQKRIKNNIGNGGHSSFYDFFAMYGILGTSIWIILFSNLFKISKCTFKKEYYISLSLLIVAIFVNPVLVNLNFVTIVYFMYKFNEI